ncbi:hypothetical protein CPC16_009489 [Podila verticillata]|nr:hypothetical protein CPC16_009489 [Podila verticillata]KFH72560.1 hypothetical protein MVEG_02849 [Podila verticillata NRRL 6337]
MVKGIFILTVALVLQCASVTLAGESDSVPRNIDAVLAKLKVDIEQARSRSGVQGLSVAIMHKGKLIFAEGFGKRNKNDPFTADTRSMIGSVTKAFTATTVGELVAEGKMDWDTTPVNTYLPEFETIDPVLTSQLTMQDLLSHRTNFPSLDIAWFWGTETRRDLIKRIKHIPVDPKFRATLNYNNAMYSVAGEAAANAAGVPIEQLVHDKILKPLGMSNSGFSNKELSKSSNFAAPFMAESYADAAAGRFVQVAMDDGAALSAAAGNMYANVLDLVRWGQVVMSEGKHDGKQVLSKEGIAATLTAHTIFQAAVRDPDEGPSIQYGMGWSLRSYKGNTLYEHSGGVFGYVSDLAVFPHAELVVGILANVDMSALPLYLPLHIADEILGLRKSIDYLNVEAFETTKILYQNAEARIKGDLPERVPNKPAVHPLNAYTGEYVHLGFGTVKVREEGGGDKLHMTLDGFSSDLIHYHFESFSIVLERSVLKMGGLITFKTGVDGKVSGFSFSSQGSAITFEKK